MNKPSSHPPPALQATTIAGDLDTHGYEPYSSAPVHRASFVAFRPRMGALTSVSTDAVLHSAARRNSSVL